MQTCALPIEAGVRDASVGGSYRAIAVVRRGGHPYHAGIPGAQVGVRITHRVHRASGCISVCIRLSRTTTWAARTLRRDTLETGSRFDDALCSRRWRGHLGGRRHRQLIPFIQKCRYCARVRFGLRLRMDCLPVSVYARHGGWFIYACALQHFLSGVAVYELPHGRHGACDDFGNEKYSGKPQTIWTGILVHYVHGPTYWFHHRVSHELVVSIPTHEARHDDGTTIGRICKRWGT